MGHPALAVGPSVHWSVRSSIGPSVHQSIRHTLLFCFFCGLWPHYSCPNDEATSNMALSVRRSVCGGLGVDAGWMPAMFVHSLRSLAFAAVCLATLALFLAPFTGSLAHSISESVVSISESVVSFPSPWSHFRVC